MNPPARVPTSLDTARVEMIRAQMPAVTRHAYFNTGTNGPLTRRALDAVTNYARDEMENGRIGQRASDRNSLAMTETRDLVAELLACDAEEIALTHNTTEGINIALLGLDWHPGDELITGGTEHEGGLNPAALLKARYGVNVVYTDIGLCNCNALESLTRALSPRTKAVVLSHVSWSTGAVLPLREICEMAHRVGALVICDAAQAAGMLPVRLYDLGVDAYALSGQKWLCGPDGVGALYIRRDLISKIQNTFTGYWGLKTRVGRADAEIQFGETAQRYQYAAHYYPALAGFAESLRWLHTEVGWQWAHQRTRELGQYAYDALSRIEGVNLYLAREQVVGLIHFTAAGISPAELTAQLYAQDILIRHVPDPALNRIATGFFNTEDDVERLVSGIQSLLK